MGLYAAGGIAKAEDKESRIMMIARSSHVEHPLYTAVFDPFRDRIRAQADLSKTNWFRVGGAAEFLFKPEDSNDLAAFLKLLPLDIPVTILGVGSNVIIRDGGIDGVVIKLGRGFTQMSIMDSQLSVGAACLDVNAAQFACDHCVGGLEFLSGIPGTIGGAVKMNGGAYGSDVSNIITQIDIVDRSGDIHQLSKEQIGFSYRHSVLPEGVIVTGALLQGVAADAKIITQKMQEIAKSREDTQPIRTRTGGSTFKNPEGHKAWELIDRAGCRGLMVGGAQVSEKHCNFFINTGDATAKDIEALGEEVRKRVKEKTDISLEWEIKRIGKIV
jgi:UDP-N-acetylmuramate dehydrogenase